MDRHSALVAFGILCSRLTGFIRQRFFAISVERKIKNPAVIAICEIARKKIFA